MLMEIRDSTALFDRQTLIFLQFLPPRQNLRVAHHAFKCFALAL